MALKAGITGGIGSGKSVVCDIFRLLGIPVFNSDREARQILESNPDVVRQVTDIFGPSVYPEPGKPDRKKIASIVFNDKEKLKLLNGIIHPAVSKRFEDWAHENEAADYVLREAAILVESGAHQQMDCIILVCAPDDLRFSRAAKRDDISEEEVRKRSLNQMKQEDLKKYATYTIINDGKELLIPQVLKIHALLKEKAHKK
ncbi:MAG TPA: dephospho-CoA kinase [Bacteroidia bacterium]|jgi:dephospho-CoA kinase|nr:dephospho-CoA kinase [Bacteroidia bacterium]